MCARSMLWYEKISYSFSSLSKDLKFPIIEMTIGEVSEVWFKISFLASHN